MCKSYRVCEKKKQKLIGNKELAYLLSRLCTIDTTVMRASVLKLVEESERSHIDIFQSRRTTWDHWKSTESLDVLLLFLLTGFCDLLQKHIVSGERFAKFLVSWTEVHLSTALQSAPMRFSRSRWVTIRKPYHACLFSGLRFFKRFVSHDYMQVTLLQSMWATAQTQVVMTESNPHANDDTSLYRPFGFSLFVSIRFRKRIWYGRL